MKKLVYLLLTLTMLLISCTALAAGKLETITNRGTLLVGTTGDYKPMSYLNKETGQYEGFDYQLAENLAAALGVKAVYVPTTWKTLTQDTLDGKFDVALCGITRTFAREKVMDMSDGYLQFGKTILVRNAGHASAKRGNPGADRGRQSRCNGYGDHRGSSLRRSQ